MGFLSDTSYWGFPTEGEWCKVPAWGYADVLKSNCAEVPETYNRYRRTEAESEVLLANGQRVGCVR